MYGRARGHVAGAAGHVRARLQQPCHRLEPGDQHHHVDVAGARVLAEQVAALGQHVVDDAPLRQQVHGRLLPHPGRVAGLAGKAVAVVEALIGGIQRVRHIQQPLIVEPASGLRRSRRQAGLGMAVAQRHHQSRRLEQRFAVGIQHRRHQTVRMDQQVGGRAMLARAHVDPLQAIGRPGLLQHRLRCQGSGARRPVEGILVTHGSSLPVRRFPPV